MPKRWMIPPPSPERDGLAAQLRIAPVLAQLLLNRQIATPADGEAFLKPSMNALPDPDLLGGANEAADLIVEKIRQQERIVIYGDYDVDGITSTAILWHLLKLIGAQVSYYIPHRLEEGYGLNADALRQIHAEGADVVITVDCGITAVEPARLARELGLTLIITDHHAKDADLPEADVLVHPTLDSHDYPNPDLCGAGVAFKLAWAIARKLSGSRRVRPELRDFLVDATGLAALGTIADVVTLLGENRVLARFGLLGLANSRLVGIQALIEQAQLTNRKLDSQHVGFGLAPRLNAAGRMGHAHLAAELLTRADGDRAKEIVLYLEEQNRKRQTLERKIALEACAMIEEGNLASDARRAIVLASENWHAGVIGIVASRIVDRYHRPTVMIALENGVGQGSARSVQHFELARALADCKNHLVTFGGHAMAAGLRIESRRVSAFTEAFVDRANQLLTARDLEPSLRIDAELTLSEAHEELIRALDWLEPFGPGNPKPRFASPLLRLEGEPKTVGRNGDHLSFTVSDGRVRRKAIAFKQADQLEPLREHRQCRLAFVPILNHYNGRTSVELDVSDLSFPT